MKSTHFCIIIALVAFVIGAIYPAPVNFVKGKIGL